MADELLRSKHAFGSESGINQAIADGKIDAYDILFLNEKKIGWIDKNGNPVILEDKEQIIPVDSLPTTDGETGVLYICQNEGYVWDESQSKCVSISKATDLSELEAEIDEKVDKAVAEAKYEKVEYVISNKPDGTIVDYRDKEIRVMCPVDTEWTLQQSVEKADQNNYYIGFKAYAPSDDIVSFKEDLAKEISDDTMYSFDSNEFAGIESNGRKYSIVWFPVANYDESSDTWTYYGEKSSVDKYIGWYYSVEWYNADGKVVASDTIRINLSNEECHSSILPSYVNDAISEAIKETMSVEVVEF